MTIGAPHKWLTLCSAIAVKMGAASVRRRQTCVPACSVTVQVNVQPLQWNIGRVQRQVGCSRMSFARVWPSAAR